MVKKIFISAFAAAAAVSAFAAYEKVEEVEPSLPLPNNEWKEIGTIKHKSASEIADSCLSVGFECLDRDMFEPEKVYDKLAEIGIKWRAARLVGARPKSKRASTTSRGSTLLSTIS